eukprot:4377183-Pyramimonas_sp.AAC.1
MRDGHMVGDETKRGHSRVKGASWRSNEEETRWMRGADDAEEKEEEEDLDEDGENDKQEGLSRRRKAE